MTTGTQGKLDLEAITERYFAAWEARDVDVVTVLPDGLVDRRDTYLGR
jgi:hypothetical protein